eukprot:SAG31_NODE_23750_length_497_cov_0.811558_1_plen_116_part_10
MLQRYLRWKNCPSDRRNMRLRLHSRRCGRVADIAFPPQPCAGGSVLIAVSNYPGTHRVASTVLATVSVIMAGAAQPRRVHLLAAQHLRRERGHEHGHEHLPRTAPPPRAIASIVSA